MNKGLEATLRSATTAIVALGFAHCSLLVGELPEPIDDSLRARGLGGGDAEAGGGSGDDSGDGLGGSGARSGAGTQGGSSNAGGNAGTTSSGGTGEAGRADSGGSSGDGASGTGANGGSDASGGAMTGGGSMTGGSSTAGGATGGQPNGGNASGGQPNGGNASGGQPNGGDASGGVPTAGSPSGGAAGSGGRGGAAPDCDGDNDGYPAPRVAGCTGPDCDDGDPNAHPDQDDFFVTQRASGGFDYDCDGNSQPEFTSVLDCSILAVGNCRGEGFSGALPACGQSGSWIRCTPTVDPLPLLCVAEDAGMRRMSCR